MDEDWMAETLSVNAYFFGGGLQRDKKERITSCESGSGCRKFEWDGKRLPDTDSQLIHDRKSEWIPFKFQFREHFQR